MGAKKQKGIFNNYKGWVRAEVQRYCKENDIGKESFHFLPIYQWENVYDRVMETFGEYDWISKNGLHWVNTNGTYTKDSSVFHCDEQWDWILQLPEIVGEDEPVYLLLEEGNKFWIGEGKPNVVAELIYEGLFNQDYYIVHKKFQWMITMNHHRCVHFVGDGFRCDVSKFLLS